MVTGSTEQKKVRIVVDKDVVETSFDKWAKPGHFSKVLSKGPKSTTWIWNLHADAHDFDININSLEDVNPGIIFLPLSQ